MGPDHHFMAAGQDRASLVHADVLAFGRIGDRQPHAGFARPASAVIDIAAFVIKPNVRIAVIVKVTKVGTHRRQDFPYLCEFRDVAERPIVVVAVQARVRALRGKSQIVSGDVG